MKRTAFVYCGNLGSAETSVDKQTLGLLEALLAEHRENPFDEVFIAGMYAPRHHGFEKLEAIMDYLRTHGFQERIAYELYSGVSRAETEGVVQYMLAQRGQRTLCVINAPQRVERLRYQCAQQLSRHGVSVRSLRVRFPWRYYLRLETAKDITVEFFKHLRIRISHELGA